MTSDPTAPSDPIENLDLVMYNAQKLAAEFEAWHELDKQARTDPSRVPPEQMAAAWEKVMEAYERWSNSR